MTQLSKAIVYMLQFPIRAYRLIFSPWVGHFCRYQPTCSAYALESLEKHGPIKGLYLTIHRLGRCHPLGGSGYDPVPEKFTLAPHKAHKN
ncbi:MAG: membrane protein insertion efficiency factor YidD [Pseudomonadota bacterium]|nr:membrane protein insertion efficiency factor YidD [Pseudomonadota bacterium]